MPQPTLRDVHIDQPLSNLSIAYRNESYIGEQIFPRLPVAKKSDYYFVFPKDAWFRDDVAVRAPGTKSAMADYTLTTASYVAIQWAISKLVPDEVRLNADSPLRPEMEATEFVTDQLLRAQERRIAAKVMSTTGWGYSTSPASQWQNDTSDPLGDIDDAINSVVGNTGRFPTVAVCSWEVWRQLRNHPDLLDRIKYTRPGGKPEPQDLINWFGFKKLLIGTSLYNKALEGQSASMSYIWDNGFWVGYVPEAAALMTPAAGYLLEWEQRTVRRYRLDEERSDKFEASHSTAECITASDAGALCASAVSVATL